MLIGAHLSIQKGLVEAGRKIISLDGNVLQVFSSPPRNWRKSRFTQVQLEEFKKSKRKIGVEKVFVHAKYLINIASKDKRIRSLSLDSLLQDLEFCEKIGAEGVIFHPHISFGKDRVIESLKELLKSFDGSCFLILENSAGEDLKEYVGIFEKLKDRRLKFCLDLAHIYQSGVDLNDPLSLNNLFETLEKNFKHKLVAIHSNNSKTKLGSKHDVHANINEGKISPNAFFVFLNHPLTCNLPFILETPGFKEKDGKSDRKNIQSLFRLKGKRLNKDFFERSAVDVARDLLGKYLIVKRGGRFLVGKIVETEAYVGPEDKASHAYGGKKTKRTRVMFEKGGRLYVYLIYGMHHCLNIVTGESGFPAAVLIRGVEPVFGFDKILDGPGKVCREFDITREDNRLDIVESNEIYIKDIGEIPEKIMALPRVGVDYAEEWAKKKLRFLIVSYDNKG